MPAHSMRTCLDRKGKRALKRVLKLLSPTFRWVQPLKKTPIISTQLETHKTHSGARLLQRIEEGLVLFGHYWDLNQSYYCCFESN